MQHNNVKQMSKGRAKCFWTGGTAQGDSDNNDWELRPGGMLVQRRDADRPSPEQGPQIKVKVTRVPGLFSHDITVPSQATFGDLKKLLVQETSLKPNEMRLLFRGKEKDDSERLHVAGVEDKAKIMFVEEPASRERRIEAMRKQEEIAKACEAVAVIRMDVDNLAEKISGLENSLVNGTPVMEVGVGVVTELLMRQLLKLDGIVADGEAKEKRRMEVKRVQSLVEAVDGLKIRNSNPRASDSSVVLTTQWETFDNGMGSLTAPAPSTIPTDWERFD